MCKPAANIGWCYQHGKGVAENMQFAKMYYQKALEQAKAQGLAVMAQTIITMQDKLNEVAEKRLLIIEKGSLQVIKDIENFYDELGTKIQDDDKYNTEKLPELLSILSRYDEGTPAHSLYMKRIEEDMALQAKHYSKQVDAISNRQTQVIDGFIESKMKIIDQTSKITNGILEEIQNQTLALNTVEKSESVLRNTLNVAEVLALSKKDE